MSNPHFQRGCILIEQGRADLAIESLKQSLALDPANAETHAILALAHQINERWKDAAHHAREALGLNPEQALPHYVLAKVHLENRRLNEAWRAINEALRIDPEDPDHLALAAAVRYQQANHQEALLLAEQGLRYDAAHNGCNNLRAVALRALGHRDAEDASLEASLHRSPENANTHANMGWSHLHRGKVDDAMYSFRESLRLDPTNDWARHGVIESLKARNIIYRVILSALLKLSHLPPRTQWTIIIGGYIAMQFVKGLAERYPQWGGLFLAVMLLYLLVVFVTWTAQSLFNVTLLFSSFGRFVLDRHQTVFAGLHAACILAGVALFINGGVLHSPAWILAGFGPLALMIPIGGAANAQTPRGKWVMYTFVAGIALLGCAALSFMFSGLSPQPLASIYFLSIGIYTWVGNAVLSFLER